MSSEILQVAAIDKVAKIKFLPLLNLSMPNQSYDPHPQHILLDSNLGPFYGSFEAIYRSVSHLMLQVFI